MGFLTGGTLRLFALVLYAAANICSSLIVGIYAYFLALLADRGYNIPTYVKAVEGIAAAGVLFTIFAIIFTCCLGGTTLFGFLAIASNVLLAGAFGAASYYTRDGRRSCSSGEIVTPLGTAAGKGFDFDDGLLYSVSPKTACQLNKAVFFVAAGATTMFLQAAVVQFLLVRSGKKEERFGPGPSNDYTSGYGGARGVDFDPVETTKVDSRT